MLCKTTILLHNFFLFYFRDSDKLIFERLQKEFEAARAAQTEGTLCYTTLEWIFVT